MKIFSAFCIAAACSCFSLPGFAQSVNTNFSDYSQAFDVSGVAASQGGSGDMAVGTGANQGEQTAPSSPNIKPIQINNTSKPQLEQANNGDIAVGSVNMAPVPSGQWSFGFSQGGPSSYWSKGGYLPTTSTGSVDLSITD